MCDDLNILRLVSFLKNILDLILLLIPIALILMTSIDLVKMVVASEDIEKKSIAMLTKRMIAAVAVFFIPTVVFVLIGMVEPDKGVLTCWTNANPEYLAKLEHAQRIEQEIKEKELEKEQNKQEENNGGSTNNGTGGGSSNGGSTNNGTGSGSSNGGSTNNGTGSGSSNGGSTNNGTGNTSKPNTSVLDIKVTNYQPFVNGVQRPLKKGDCMKKEDNCFCPSIDGFRGFQFTVGDETTREFNWYSLNEKSTKVVVTCPGGSKITQYVNEKVKDKFEKAFTNICKLQTIGINGIKLDLNNIKYGGTWSMRTNSTRWVCSNHSYGNAIDINYSLSLTVNGKNYMPFAGQGVNTRKEYDAFVQVLGKELDARNVNYILWKYAFEPAGFIWGGNWDDEFFDPMHYEVKIGA